MKIAFVTGGSGHLGGNLIRQLLAQGWAVRCLIHHDVRALEGLSVERVEGNLSDKNRLIKQMAGCDAVFHTAAYVAVENVNFAKMKAINIDGTATICQAALDAHIPKFIHFSSIHAFQQRPTNQPLLEERPLVSEGQSAPYDQTKAAAQRVVYDACDRGLNASILHPTGIIGPYDFKPSRMGQVLKDIMNKKMPLTINAGFNWVDVRDICESAIKCVDQGRSGQHYILPGEWATFRQISDIISEHIDSRTALGTLPFWVAYTALPFAYAFSKLTGKRPSFSRGSFHALAVQCKDIPGTLAKNQLGHSPRSLQNTIQDTIDWIKNYAH
jgi:dihydroflavonol-4-reductase